MNERHIVTVGFERLRVRCIIGVRPRERRRPQTLLVDCSLRYDASEAVEADRVERAIDYSALARRVSELLTARRYGLLERAVADVAAALLAGDPRIRCVTGTIRKPAALRSADSACASITRARDA